MNKKNYIPFQVNLEENERPKAWFNIRADFPDIEPYISSDGKIVKEEDLYAIFPKELARQELTMERYIPIPEAVDRLYREYRPTPLHRAYALEEALGTPAKLYYKYEGNNPSGSHKLNTAIPQAYYNKIEGTKTLTTETGAGQWGTALAIACNAFDLNCEVYMVKSSAVRKPARREIMKSFGANVYASPTNLTKSGRDILKKDPDSSGSLGIAISEAIEAAVSNKKTKYALGSVLNHVATHQTIIGLESLKQFEKINVFPDTVIACCGGGSNFAGMTFPFVSIKKNENREIDIIGVEPDGCPTMTRGKYTYDYGDIARFTPKMLQYTLGSSFMPPKMHAGGLRYHGMGSLVSRVVHDGYARAVSVGQKEVFEAGLFFAKNELILPAPESSHAIAQAIKEALICKETKQEKVILFNVTGHGQLDASSYTDYKEGRMVDNCLTEEALQVGLSSLEE